MAETPDVKVYALSTCAHCKNAKKFLDNCEVSYDSVEVDLLDGDQRQAILEEVKALNPRCSFPTIKIGDNVIVGYNEDKIKEALGIS
ncbi:MAG: glutaredoxin family protein [Desulfobacterales bacterium]